MCLVGFILTASVRKTSFIDFNSYILISIATLRWIYSVMLKCTISSYCSTWNVDCRYRCKINDLTGEPVWTFLFSLKHFVFLLESNSLRNWFSDRLFCLSWHVSDPVKSCFVFFYVLCKHPNAVCLVRVVFLLSCYICFISFKFQFQTGGAEKGQMKRTTRQLVGKK